MHTTNDTTPGLNERIAKHMVRLAAVASSYYDSAIEAADLQLVARVVLSNGPNAAPASLEWSVVIGTAFPSSGYPNPEDAIREHTKTLRGRLRAELERDAVAAVTGISESRCARAIMALAGSHGAPSAEELKAIDVRAALAELLVSDDSRAQLRERLTWLRESH